MYLFNVPIYNLILQLLILSHRKKNTHKYQNVVLYLPIEIISNIIYFIKYSCLS